MDRENEVLPYRHCSLPSIDEGIKKKIEYTKKEQNTKRELCIISFDRYRHPSRTAACPVDIIEKQEERGADRSRHPENLKRPQQIIPIVEPEKINRFIMYVQVVHYSPFSSAGATVVVGVLTAPNSDPTPLCPRFLPGIWNPKDVDDLLAGCWVSLDESPNRAKRPLFLGLASSLRPTSSKASSSMRSGRSKLVDRIVGELRRQKRESRDVREGAASACITGERAEMSCKELVWVCMPGIVMSSVYK